MYEIQPRRTELHFPRVFAVYLDFIVRPATAIFPFLLIKLTSLIELAKAMHPYVENAYFLELVSCRFYYDNAKEKLGCRCHPRSSSVLDLIASMMVSFGVSSVHVPAFDK